MNPSSYVLFEQNGLVFETHTPDQHWSFAEEWGGRRVGADAPDIEEIVLSLCFVLPPLLSEPGSYNVLTLSRRSAGADSSAGHDVFLEVAYDASQSVLKVRTAADTTLCLAGLESRIVAERVLRLFVIVNNDTLYASVNFEDGDDDLLVFGELPGPGWSVKVWGSPAAGLWRVVSGSEPAESVPTLAFPPGFGLSDVQVLILGGPGSGDRHLPYSGALDHLTRWHSHEDWIGGVEGVETGELLEALVEDFDSDTWFLEQLARRLRQEP